VPGSCRLWDHVQSLQDTPQTYLQQAFALERAGRLAEAAAAYERLLARWPDLADGWYNLGLLQRKTRRYAEALSSYRQALDRGVEMPEEVHLNRGVIFSDCLRQPLAAEQELEAALAINPRYVPALLNLANLHEDRGRRDRAQALYEQVLALDPQCFEALARHANLQSVSSPDDIVLSRLRQALALPRLQPADRASLGFALGRALDSCDSYDLAFEAYSQANRASRESAPPESAYDRALMERFVDELIEVFSHDFFDRQAPASQAAPLFVCGMFRSGSTLTEQVLAAHPRVTPGGELELLPAMVRSQLAPFPAALTRLASAELPRLALRYLEALQLRFPGATVVTDKRPDNFLYIGLIKALFPRARIVHTRRAPLDNCLSIYFLHLDHAMAYATDLKDIGHYYRQYRRLMAHWKSLFGDEILDFDYDSFVHAPRPAVERLLDYCGLGWDENCLAFNRVDGAVRTASVWQVREPLYQRSSGRWRNYERQLAQLVSELADLLPGPAAAR